jgi:hypothetical protein
LNATVAVLPTNMGVNAGEADHARSSSILCDLTLCSWSIL